MKPPPNAKFVGASYSKKGQIYHFNFDIKSVIILLRYLELFIVEPNGPANCRDGGTRRAEGGAGPTYFG